jgi:hypothetical protein
MKLDPPLADHRTVCLTTDTFPNCSSSNLSKSTASHWPDVPFDQICATQSATCSNYAPSFFTTRRLTSISTSVLAGSGHQPVDDYALDQMFPAPEAGVVSGPGVGDGAVAVMWLDSIQHTGEDKLAGGRDAEDDVRGDGNPEPGGRRRDRGGGVVPAANGLHHHGVTWVPQLHARMVMQIWPVSCQNRTNSGTRRVYLGARVPAGQWRVQSVR